jgi:hypothetical protein
MHKTQKKIYIEEKKNYCFKKVLAEDDAVVYAKMVSHVEKKNIKITFQSLAILCINKYNNEH